MGRKKGRQRGSFATKAQRASYQSQIRERASEVDRKPYLGTTGTWSSAAPSSSSLRPSERPRVSVMTLRGILAERRLQDRAIDGEMRRFLSNQNTVIRSENAGRNAAMMRLSATGLRGKGDDAVGGTDTPRHEPGWLLTYDHDRDFSKEGQDGGGIPVEVCNFNDGDCAARGSTERMPSTLQALCVSALAPVLRQYVSECGSEAVSSAMGMLPGPVLADLSALYCRSCLCEDENGENNSGVDDEIAAVLGHHGHAECLALHAVPFFQDDAESDDSEDELGVTALRSRRKTFTDAGILSLVPRLAGTDGPLNKSIGTNNHAEPLGSWEELDIDSSAQIQGCNLKRLELCNAHSISAQAFTKLLHGCRGITHLSISGSFNDESGESLLLHRTDGIVALLTNLRVLDLSHCPWLTDELLAAFLLKVLPAVCRLPTCGGGCEALSNTPKICTVLDEIAGPLEMVNVAGCPGLTLSRVKELNSKLRGRPHVSTQVQKRRRWSMGGGVTEGAEGEGGSKPCRGELVAVKRWKDKRAREAMRATIEKGG